MTDPEIQNKQPIEVTDMSEEKVLKLVVQVDPQTFFMIRGAGDNPYTRARVARFKPNPSLGEDMVSKDGQEYDISNLLPNDTDQNVSKEYLIVLMRRLASSLPFINQEGLGEFVEHYAAVQQLMDKLKLPDHMTNDLVEFAYKQYDKGYDDHIVWEDKY